MPAQRPPRGPCAHAGWAGRSVVHDEYNPLSASRRHTRPISSLGTGRVRPLLRPLLWPLLSLESNPNARTNREAMRKLLRPGTTHALHTSLGRRIFSRSSRAQSPPFSYAKTTRQSRPPPRMTRPMTTQWATLARRSTTSSRASCPKTMSPRRRLQAG